MTKYSEALEQKYAALLYSKGNAHLESMGSKQSRIFGLAERWALRVADAYFWSADISQVVKASSLSLPQDTKILVPIIPDTGAFWWWFEHPLRFNGSFGDVAAILVWAANPHDETSEHRHIVITTYGTQDGVHFECKDTLSCLEFLTLESIDHATRVADNELTTTSEPSADYQQSAQELIRMVMAGLLWIEQPILRQSSVPLERHAKKRILKAGLPPADIRVITLRRMHYEHEKSEETVEWSCRWIVRGHWRQQYHPSTGERKPLWILPYVKGPDDKPLRVPKAEVFAITR